MGFFVDEDCASDIPSLRCHWLAQLRYSLGGDPSKKRAFGWDGLCPGLQGATDRACPFSLPDCWSSAFIIAIWRHRLTWMSTCSAPSLFFNEICFQSRMEYSLWCLKISADLSWLCAHPRFFGLAQVTACCPTACPKLDLLVLLSVSLEISLKQAVLCACSHLKISVILKTKIILSPA